MTTTLCTACTHAPKGRSGHARLELQVEGPYPGHHIFKCTSCGARWIRHYGAGEDNRGWTQFAQQFGMRKPMPDDQRPQLAGRTR